MLAPTKNQEALTPSTHPQTLTPKPYALHQASQAAGAATRETMDRAKTTAAAVDSTSREHRDRFGTGATPARPVQLVSRVRGRGRGGGGDCARGRSGARGWGCSPGEGAGNARREEPETPQRAPG